MIFTSFCVFFIVAGKSAYITHKNICEVNSKTLKAIQNFCIDSNIFCQRYRCLFHDFVLNIVLKCEFKLLKAKHFVQLFVDDGVVINLTLVDLNQPHCITTCCEKICVDFCLNWLLSTHFTWKHSPWPLLRMQMLSASLIWKKIYRNKNTKTWSNARQLTKKSISKPSRVFL